MEISIHACQIWQAEPIHACQIRVHAGHLAGWQALTETLKYTYAWFLKWLRLYFWKITFTLVIRFTLWVACKGHENKKWFVPSVRWLQRHLPEDVSRKLWRFYDTLEDLNQFSTEKGFEVLRDHEFRKYFFSGRKRDNIWFLRIPIDGVTLKWEIILFQEEMPSGKKAMHVSEWVASYFVKSITIDLTVQRPSKKRKFIFEITRGVIIYNLMNL